MTLKLNALNIKTVMALPEGLTNACKKSIFPLRDVTKKAKLK
jgi:hypothetical protein